MSMIHLIHTSAHPPAGGAGLTPSWLAEDEWQGHCETAHLQGNTETLPSPSVMVATYNMYIWNFRWLVLYNVMHLLAYPKIRRKYPYPLPSPHNVCGITSLLPDSLAQNEWQLQQTQHLYLLVCDLRQVKPIHFTFFGSIVYTYLWGQGTCPGSRKASAGSRIRPHLETSQWRSLAWQTVCARWPLGMDHALTALHPATEECLNHIHF